MMVVPRSGDGLLPGGAWLLDLPKISDPRGNLSFIESGRHVPFPVQRVYWLYDVPGGELREGHAYRRSAEFLVALSGSFDVGLRDGHSSATITLSRSYRGLYVPPMTWRQFVNFSTNAICLVLASTHFDEADYIRDVVEFRARVADGARA